MAVVEKEGRLVHVEASTWRDWIESILTIVYVLIGMCVPFLLGALLGWVAR